VISSEFLVYLESVSYKFNWKLRDDTLMIPDRRQKPRLRIRASSGGLIGILFDPIGAVCYSQTGKIYEPSDWIAAADAIGLSLIIAGDLTAAINDRIWEDKHPCRGPSSYLHDLREQLLELTGLSSGVLAGF